MSFVGSALGSLFGSSSGGVGQALTQAGATAVQAQALNQLQSNIAPFVSTGQQMSQQLGSEINSGQLGQPFNLTQQQLAATPGYQWALQQGLESTQNAAAARGLGVSGAALKGAANFATGLASNTYQQQFQDYWANQQNRYNMLYNLAGQGVNAATGTANAALTGAANVGTGISGIGNALSQGMQNLSNINTLTGLLNTGGTTGAAASLFGGGASTLAGAGDVATALGSGAADATAAASAFSPFAFLL